MPGWRRRPGLVGTAAPAVPPPERRVRPGRRSGRRGCTPDAIEPRFRMLILLATFASLRWGELAALQRKNLDLDAGTIHVVGTTTELKDGSVTIGPPKSEAGKRLVSIPATLLPDLREHMETYAEKGEHGHVFVGPKGAKLRRANFARVWAAALKKAELGGFHFHDLRHGHGRSRRALETIKARAGIHP
ncbi:site-specific integrase [Nonomuraea longispora]|uniref:Site-specific integrase n=2 Tax=Nonomuraea longispora TaxID=1848320 RepID=A0A4R4NAN0_9ACTN|nr:site-specific integrase [Nonomuraea longispora]